MLLTLPTELLCEIAHYLDKRTLGSLARTHSRLYAPCMEDLWGQVSVTYVERHNVRARREGGHEFTAYLDEEGTAGVALCDTLRASPRVVGAVDIVGGVDGTGNIGSVGKLLNKFVIFGFLGFAQAMTSPWPQPTPAPAARQLNARQVIADQADVDKARVDCQLLSGNDVFSCFPTSSTVMFQREWASFVWNSRRPELTQTNLVDVFLFRADSRTQLLHFRELPNPSDQAGLVTAQINDTWFGTDGLRFNGTQQPFPFYWVIIRSDKTLDGNEVPQPVFTAVQTTVLDSVAAASSSSAAAASSSAILASLSSLSASATLTSTPLPSASGNVQSQGSASAFPRWAIAVIVVLGFLAITATCLLAFLILRRIRRRKQLDSSRNSMGSASPMINNNPSQDPDMIQRYDSPGSPLLHPPSAPGAFAAAAGTAPSSHDNASSISEPGGPFSGADAAIMADAFRKMLRKPDFLDRPVEAEENDSPPDTAGPDPPDESNRVLSRELAEEGRDIRSVSSSRGVKVEGTASDPLDPR